VAGRVGFQHFLAFFCFRIQKSEARLAKGNSKISLSLIFLSFFYFKGYAFKIISFGFYNTRLKKQTILNLDLDLK
jgi:hypothetical protein